MTAHFLTSYRAGRRWCVGALVPVQPSPLGMIDALLETAQDLNLLTHAQVRSIWSDLWQSTERAKAPDKALDRIATILTWYAPPGYTFQPWFVRGTVFWGWFPRVG